MFSKFKNLLSAKNSFAGATLILILTLVCSNILGLLRNRFLAQKITPYHLDTYLAAFRIPDLVFNLLLLGAVFAVFIPIFTEYISKKKYKTAWHIANSMVNLVVIGTIAISIVLFFLMPVLIKWLVPGFDAFQQAQTIKLTRLLLLSPLFFGISYIFSGILNSFRRFVVYSLAPLAYNIAIILAVIFLSENLGVWGVTLGVIFGAFLHMMIQLPIVIQLGYRWQPIVDLKHPEIKKMGKLMIPRSIGLAAAQVVLIIFTFLASKWSGHVTYFNFANDIQTFFSVVFGSSFAVAVFPILSENAAKNETRDFNSNLRVAFKQILYFTLPFSILIIMLRAEIVRLLLGTGFFGWEATVITADNLGAFAIGISAASVIQLTARAYYAYKDMLTPTIMALISGAISVVLGIILSQGIGSWRGLESVGLAIALSIGSIINFILLAIFQRDRALFWNRKLFLPILKYLVALIVLIVVAQICKVLTGNIVNMQTFLGVLIKTATTIILSFAVYIGLTYLWGCEEIGSFIKIFKQKVGFKIKKAEEVAIEERGKTES